jgi:hypothetical protein
VVEGGGERRVMERRELEDRDYGVRSTEGGYGVGGEEGMVEFWYGVVVSEWS